MASDIVNPLTQRRQSKRSQSHGVVNPLTRINDDPNTIVSSAKRLAGQTLASVGRIGEDAGIENSVDEYGADLAYFNPRQTSSFGDIVRHPLTTIKEQAGELAPQLAQYAAGSKAGAAIGWRLGGARGAVVGGALGAAAPTFVQSYGPSRERALDNGIDSIPRAIASAAAQAGLETAFGPERILGKAFAGGAIRAGENRLKGIGRNIVAGAAEEFPTEVGQQAIEQVQAGESPLTGPNVYESTFGGTLGAISGGLGGGAVGALSPRERTQTPPQTDADPDTPDDGLPTPEPDNGPAPDTGPGPDGGPLAPREAAATRSYAQWAAFVDDQWLADAAASNTPGAREAAADLRAARNPKLSPAAREKAAERAAETLKARGGLGVNAVPPEFDEGPLQAGLRRAGMQDVELLDPEQAAPAPDGQGALQQGVTLDNEPPPQASDTSGDTDPQAARNESLRALSAMPMTRERADRARQALTQQGVDAEIIDHPRAKGYFSVRARDDESQAGAAPGGADAGRSARQGAAQTIAGAREFTPGMNTPSAPLSEPLAETRDNGGRADSMPPAKAVADMSPDELRASLLVDAATGIPNRRAFDEAPMAPAVGIADLDGLKYVNDTFGHASGDALLKAAAQALHAASGRKAHRLHGDEFALRADDEGQATAALDKANELLSKATLTFTRPDGQTETHSGFGFSYGTGQDLGQADARLGEHKDARTRAGLRVGRGQAPQGDLGAPAAGDQGNVDLAERPDSDAGEPGQELTSSGAADNAPQNQFDGLPVYEQPLDGLSLSADVPQFKAGADESSGVVEPLQGTFDRTGVAPVQVWERNDGKREVISGRHRLDLARRSGETTIPVQVHREADGFDAQMAGRLDAELNIRDEQGSVNDYATYFKDAGITEAEAQERGLLSRSKGRSGFSIAQSATEPLFEAHRAGQVSDEGARRIGEAAPGDERLQSVGLDALNRGRSITEAVNTQRAVSALQAETSQQGDIFGFDDSGMRQAEAMAKIASGKQRAIRERVASVRGAANRPEAARTLGVNVKDPAAVKREIERLQGEAARWDNWNTDAELVGQIRAEMQDNGASNEPVSDDRNSRAANEPAPSQRVSNESDPSPEASADAGPADRKYQPGQWIKKVVLANGTPINNVYVDSINAQGRYQLRGPGQNGPIKLDISESELDQAIERAKPRGLPGAAKSGDGDATQTLDAADRPENFNLAQPTRTDAQAEAEAQGQFNADQNDLFGGQTQAAQQQRDTPRNGEPPDAAAGGGLFAQASAPDAPTTRADGQRQASTATQDPYQRRPGANKRVPTFWSTDELVAEIKAIARRANIDDAPDGSDALKIMAVLDRRLGEVGMESLNDELDATVPASEPAAPPVEATTEAQTDPSEIAPAATAPQQDNTEQQPASQSDIEDQYQDAVGDEITREKRRLRDARAQRRTDKAKASEQRLRRLRQQVFEQPPAGWQPGQTIDGPAATGTDTARPVIEDDRQRQKRRQAREIGRQAGRDGDERVPPDYLGDDLGNEWLAGYGDVIAEQAKQAAADRPTTYGAANKVISNADYEKLAAELRAKLGNLNAGFDPDLYRIGMQMAVYHVEAGARTFQQFGARMVGEFGDGIRPYLKLFYNGARDYPDDAFDARGMDSVEMVRDADVNAIAPAAESATLESQAGEDTNNDGQRNSTNRQEPLAPAPAELVQPDQGRPDPGRAGDGGRQADASRDGSPDAGGRDRSPGVGRGQEPVRADEPGSGNRADEQRELGEPLTPPEPTPAEANPEPIEAGNSTPPGRARAAQLTGDNPGNYRITDADAIGTGTRGQRIDNNIAAIETAKALEAEGRYATADEQTVMAKYVGWGGLKRVFQIDDKSAAQDKRANARLRELLTEAEFAAAQRSILDAHYTSPAVVRGLYDAVAHLGISGGRVLEPSVGAGNFLGLMPASMIGGSRVDAVELDTVSAAIAKHLYPDAQIVNQGFQKANLPYAGYDLVIGNPPFGDRGITDNNKARKAINGFSIHNYFIAKSAMHMKPGGIMGVVVTNNFLDKPFSKEREYLAGQLQFLGAVRLSNRAFAESAGTEVTTDLVFFRKPVEQSDLEQSPAWANATEFVNDDGDTVRANEYFANHPHLMLGKPTMGGTMYGTGAQFTLEARPGQDIAADLAAVLRSPEFAGLRNVAGTRETQAAEVTAVEYRPNLEDLAIGDLALDDGAVVQRLDDDAEGNPAYRTLTADTQWTEKTQLGETRLARIRGMLGVRNAAYALMTAERKDTPDIEALRTALNNDYDAFVKAFGYINDTANASLLGKDVRVEVGLEGDYKPAISKAKAKRLGVAPRAASASKESLLVRRVNYPRRAVERVSSARDGYVVSATEKGRLDLDYIAALYGQPQSQVIAELSEGDKPLIYQDPETNQWIGEDVYLSGNVKAKLRKVEGLTGFEKNAASLRSVQPVDVAPDQINANFGASWIPASVYEQFAEAIGIDKPQVNVSTAAGLVTLNRHRGASQSGDYAEYRGAGSMTQAEVFNRLASGKPLVVRYTDSDGKSYVSEQATDALRQAATAQREFFRDWITAEPDRAAHIAKVFNDTMNTTIERAYDGSLLRLTGANPAIKLRDSQARAAWRMVQSDRTLLDHVVGAGKTYTVIAGIMERRRMGLTRKPMVVVPNHKVGDWAADWLKMYPGANVLAATNKDFTAKNRRRLFARIATGDYDAIVVGHSSFGFIPMLAENEARFIREQIAILERAKKELGDNGDASQRRTVRNLENSKAKLEGRIEKLMDEPRDAVATLEEMGIDSLTVDESHEFKNLMISTSMTNIAGMGNLVGSKKAMHLFMAMRQIQQQDGSTYFATGTPIANTMTEMYTVLRYLNYEALEERNLEAFDAWARAHASVEDRVELGAGGKFKQRAVMATFQNMPELMQVYNQVADVVTSAELQRMYSAQIERENAETGANERTEFPAPKVKGGGRRLNLAAPNPLQEQYSEYLRARADALQEGNVDPSEDNMLLVITDSRKMSMDIRMVDPDAGDYANNKTSRATSEIKRIYDEWHADRGTQLVFSDLGTPVKFARGNTAKIVASMIAKLPTAERARATEVTRNMEPGDAGEYLAERMNQLIDDAPELDATLEALQAYTGGELRDDMAALSTAQAGFSVYDDLKAKLIAAGIPENEIAFIHDYNTPKAKSELFDLVNSGQIRVLMGSTAKMGAGTNVQERIVGLHHLDAPWRPADVEQREGRAIRQGNVLYNADPDNFTVDIQAYSTERTLDSMMWQTLARKQEMLGAFRSGASREMADVHDDGAGYSDFMAESTGNPVFKEQAQLKLEAKDLRSRKRRVAAERSGAEYNVRALPDRIAKKHDDQAKLARAAEAFEAADDATITTGDGRRIPADYGAKAQPLIDAWRDKMAAFEDKQVAHNKALQQWEAAPPDTRGDKPKGPTRPPRPAMATLGKKSKEAKFYDELRAAIKEGDENDTPFEIEYSVAGVPIALDFDPMYGGHLSIGYNGAEPVEIPTTALDSRLMAHTQPATAAKHAGEQARERAASVKRDQKNLDESRQTLDKVRFDGAERLEAIEQRLASANEEIEALEAELRAKAQESGNPYMSGKPHLDKFSRGGARPRRGLDVARLRAALREQFGPGIARMEAAGTLTLVDSDAELPARLQGRGARGVVMAGEGRVYLVAERLTPDNIKGVFVHEVGVHYGLADMLGEDAFAGVLDRLAAMRRIGNPKVRAAYAKVPESTPLSLRDEEALGYLVEAHPDLPIVRRLIAKLRAFLFRTFGIGGDRLSDADMVALAQGTARRAVRGEGRTQARGSQKTVPAFSGERQPDNGAPRLAPNGQPSNLNARQHAQVRTLAFKRWFGDWEAAAKRIPAVELTLEGWQGSATDLGRMARKAYADDLQGQTVDNDSLGHAVIFSAEGKGEAFGARGKMRKPVRAEMVRALREIVGRAQAVQQSAPDSRRRHDTRAFHTLVAPLRANGQTYAVKVTVREALRSDKTPPHKFYDVTSIQISESPGVHGVDDKSSRPAPAEASGPSVAELAQAFNIDMGVSQIVDANGEPLVVYHGTAHDIESFRSGRDFKQGHGKQMSGVYFSELLDTANAYADSAASEKFEISDGKFTGQNVVAAFVSLQNPKIFSGRGSLEAFRDAESSNLARDGYDGAIRRNDAGQAVEIVAFKPEQIKSATGNRGSYDSANPDIRYSRVADEGEAGSRADTATSNGATAGTTPRTRYNEPLFSIDATADDFNDAEPIDNAKAEALRRSGLAWASMSPQQRMTAAMTHRWEDFKTNVLGRWREGFFDQFAPIKAAEGDVAPEHSGYLAARLSTGASSTMYASLLYGAPQWQNGIIGKKAHTRGLLSIMDPIKGEMNAWLGWMVAQRAEYLADQGRENNMRAEDIAELKRGVTGDTLKRYEAVAAQFRSFNTDMLRLARDAGLLSDAQVKAFANDRYYVPFYRVDEAELDADPTRPFTKRGLSHQDAGIKTLKGGQSALADPLENVFSNMQRLIDASLKNQAMRQTIANTQDLMTPEPEGNRGDDDVVRVMKDGQAQYYRVADRALLRSLAGINAGPLAGLGLFRTFKRMLTVGVTADPAFVMRNFARDMLQAWLVDKNGFKFATDSLAGAKDTLASLRDRDNADIGLQTMMFAGSSFVGGHAYGDDPTSQANALRRALRAKGLTPDAVDNHMASIVDTPAKWWSTYRELGDAAENANRMAVYRAAVGAGRTPIEAVFEAKDLMDFSLQGNFTFMKVMSDMLPFFNARVQGLYKLGRAGMDNPQQLAQRGLMVMGATLALAAANAGNDDYDELPGWEKDLYWHLFLPGGAHLRIPKPFELGILFGTMPERMARAALGQDSSRESYQALLRNLGQVMALDPTPQLINPALETYMNYDKFRDRPIENLGDQGKLPGARYSAYTSPTMVGIGGALNIRPKKLEHIWGGYLGTLGSYALGTSDWLVRQARGDIGPSMTLNDVPVVSAFVRGSGPNRSTKYASAFYDLLNEANQVSRTITQYRESGQIEAARELMASNRGLLGVRKSLGAAQRQASNLRDRMDQVRASESLSSEAKRERLDNMQRMLNRVMRQAAEQGREAQAR